MATWSELLGYTASGTVLGLAAKAILDVVLAERSHTLELRRRFFDTKLEASLAAIREVKVATSLLRIQCALFRRSLQPVGSVHPKILEAMSQSIQETADRFKHSSLGEAWATLGFFYGDRVFASDKGMRDQVMRLVERISQLSFIGDSMAESLSHARTASVPDPGMAATLLEHIGKVLLQINQLDEEARALDDLVDRLTPELSRSFGRLRV
jgi:hypothetical protein